ncbi:hypothetical protein ES703_109710 [subsurface metagenome]
MTIDSDDNVYVAGITPSKDAYLTKYSPLGELLKTVIWGGSAYDSGLAVPIDSNSNVYLAGDTQSFGILGYKNCFLAKYNANGVQQWNVTWIGTLEDHMCDIVVDSQDNVIIVGYTKIFGPMKYDLIIKKYNATGHLDWETEWGSGLDDYPYKALIDSEDNVYIWGRSYDPSPGPSYTYILKVNSSGLTTLLKEFSKYPIYDLTLDSEDNLIVLGHFYTGKKTLRKYDNEFISYTQYTEWNDYEIYDYNLALDGQDNMYVGGGWYCLMKFNDTGINYWKFTKDESCDQYRLTEIAVDSQQNIYCLCNNWSNSHLYMYDNSSHAVTCLKSPKFAAKELYATIVGCGNYYGEDYDLPFVYKDRQAMVEHLRKDCNVPSQNIESLSDAWSMDIKNALTDVRLVISEEDEYLFYFSGHGGTYSGDSCIYPYDSLPPYSSSYRIDCDDLDWYLDRIECENTYVFIDACHSGGFTTSDTEPGEFIMSACKQNEVSIETYELGHGTFTYYLLDSYANVNDDNEDGLISLEEQYTSLQ